MATTDTEKAFKPYTDDEHAEPHATVPAFSITSLKNQRPRWFSWKTAFLVAIIVALLLSRLVEGLVKAHRHRQSRGNERTETVLPISAIEPPEIVVPSKADANEPATSHPADVSEIAILNDPGDLDLPVQPEAIGVSIAASVDSDGSRQVYDLDSEGTIRLRKIKFGTYRYTSPEVVTTNQKPKPASPLAALAWRANGLSVEHRLFYLNVKSQIVELAGVSVNATAPTKWTVKTVFGNTASGGLAAVNIGPRYDPKTLAGQIRVFYVDANGQVQCLNTLNDKWYINFSKFTAVKSSDLAVNVKRNDTSGQVTDISVIYVDPKEGLKEFTCDEKNNRNQYFPGRSVDPTFSTTSLIRFGSTYGGPPSTSRVYTLTATSPVERTGTVDGKFTNVWWSTTDNSWYAPQNPGGSVAAVAWAGKEVRVYYKSTNGERIAELGVSDQSGAAVRWFPRGFIN